MERKMKRTIFIVLVLLTALSMLFGYTLKWANYDLINPGSDLTRSLAYNPVADHVYVVTRTNEQPRIVILNPETGTQLGTLKAPSGGFQDGVCTVNMVTVSEDGTIYVCNLHAPQVYGHENDHFRIYRYDAEDSVPVLIFKDSMNSIRYGDSFASIGSGDNTYLYSSGWQSDKLAILKVSSSLASIEKIITLPSINSARHGISPVEPAGNLWINGAGDSFPPPRLIDYDGGILAEVPDTIIAAGGTSSVLHWLVGPINVVTATNTFLSNTLKSARYFVDELGTVTFDYLGEDSDSLMLLYQGTTANMNQNGSCAMSYDDKRHCLYSLMGLNSIAAVDLNSLIQVATPRDAGLLAVQLDGKNKEYTHYEHLGTAGDRELYLTWSHDIIYIAINGSTLLAPYQQQALYVAFDTDPDGADGSTTPPDGAASLQALPFAADVVVRLDSEDELVDIYSNSVEDKWTTGYVYKWNGSGWISAEIPGLDIGHGAMCLIGDGTDSLITEIGIARNPVGIGTDVSQMRVKVYLAETAGDGSVLAVYPDDNETGSGVSFTSYYEFGDMGDGIYPAYAVAVHKPEVGVLPEEQMPEAYRLGQNYPNPFNPGTEITYTLMRGGAVSLAVYNLRGCLVQELLQGYQPAGVYRHWFDGGQLSSGIYLYQLKVDGIPVAIRKMALLK
jgi:hypothetical protein